MSPASIWRSRRALLWSGVVATIVSAAVAVAVLGRLHREMPARLAFVQTELSLTAAASATELQVTFPFRNVGGRPVRILQVETDCSCTSGARHKEQYSPGETGSIDVTFKPGARTGLQRRGVVIHTDNPAQPLVPLTLVVSVPEIMKLQAEYLLWKADEPANPKSFTVQISRGVDVRSLRAASNSPHLEVAVESFAPAEYRVHITPRANRRDITAAVYLEAVLADDQRKQMTAFIRVR
jgi:hypothetical protein